MTLKTLRDLVAETKKEPKKAMICHAHIQHLDEEGESKQETLQVLTEFGRRVLHGVLTCILSAHSASMSFDGACGMDKLMVHFYEQRATGKIVVFGVYVPDDDGLSSLDGENQKKDYKTLEQVIGEMFPLTTLHVGSIHKLLAEDLVADDDDRPCSEKQGFDLLKRTHLLQAYAAMISSPVAVATMCLNLKRFYDQLPLHSTKRYNFERAMSVAQQFTCPLIEEVDQQPLFKTVFDYKSPSQNNNNTSSAGNDVPDSPYSDRTGMGMFNFARNWFAHPPINQRWVDKQTENFEAFPHLDYIFTFHFRTFIPKALLELYRNFSDDHNLLTRILVPLP